MDAPTLRAFVLGLLVSFSPLALASSVRAQDGEVIGRVVDAETQTPLPGSNVLLVAPESGDRRADRLSTGGGHSALTAAVFSGIGTVQGDGFGYSYGQIRFRAGDFFAQGCRNKNDAGESFVYGSGLSVVDRGDPGAQRG